MADSYTAPANPAQPGNKTDPASTKMSSDDLTALVRGEFQSAYTSFNASELSIERSQALDYYNGDMTRDMPTMDGRSSAMSMDVLETVEGLMPDLMEVFCGNEDVVEFQPTGPEDVDAAQQETDYVNHVFMQQNPGFIVLYSMIKDALLSKVGVVKVFWEKETRDKRETYQNLSQDVYQLLVADDEIEIVAETKKPDPLNPANPPMYDCTVSVKQEVGKARVVPVPPEEFGISRMARSIEGAPYCFHRVKTRTAADLKAAGYDATQISSIASSSGLENSEEQARNTVETSLYMNSSTNQDQRMVTITEHYIRCDYDGRGATCIWRVVTGGSTSEILIRDGEEDIEEVDEMPFAAMTPVIMTHRFWGKSVADLVIDIQKVKTALFRGILDNVYLANNQRAEVAETGVTKNTIDDWLENRPGGMVRVKQAGTVNLIPNQPIGDFVYPMIEYVDTVREFRSGVSKAGQGLDPNSLQNVSATTSNLSFSAAKSKSRLIARIFAETGVRDMFLLLHAIIRKNDREDNTVRLRNKWVTINPRDWRERNNMTVNVGLGTGSKAEQMAMMQNIINLQSQAFGAQIGIVTPQNLYASAKRMTELAGLKTADPYWTDPSSQPPQQPPPNPAMEAANAKIQALQLTTQAQVQATQQKTQADIVTTQQKTQADIEANNQKIQAQMVADHNHAQLKSELMQQDFAEKATLRRMQTAHSLAQPDEMP